MRTDKDGGSVFPAIIEGGKQYSVCSYGMSLRDYFAAAALTGIASRPNPLTGRAAAVAAYHYADSLLAERADP